MTFWANTVVFWPNTGVFWANAVAFLSKTVEFCGFVYILVHFVNLGTAFGRIRVHLCAFVCIWVHSGAFWCLWVHSDAFRCISVSSKRSLHHVRRAAVPSVRLLPLQKSLRFPSDRHAIVATAITVRPTAHTSRGHGMITRMLPSI